MNDSLVRWWSVSVLTWENFNKWFLFMQNYLISEDLWFMIESFRLNTPDSDNFNSLDFRSQRTNDKAQYWLIMCIDDDNQEYLTDKITAREVWNALKSKYQKKLQTTRRQYLMKYVTYKMLINIFIDEAWTYLDKIDKKMFIIKSNLKFLCDLTEHFQSLLQTLSKKYSDIWDEIDTQVNSDIKTSLQKLQEKKTLLKAEKTALWTGLQHKKKQSTQNQQWQDLRHWSRKLLSSESDNSSHWTQHKQLHHNFLNCFLCDDFHHMLNCEHFSDVHKQYRSKKSSKSTAVMFKHKMFINRLYQKRKHQIYDVKTELNESTDFSSESETEKKVVEKIAALSKTIISKISRDHWVTDSDFFSHMTDQLWLFSDSLMSIQQCSIKIRERRLYVYYCDTVTMQDQFRNSVLLLHTLYVSKLEVNLLSEKQMCEKKLQRSFDQHRLYMCDRHDKIIIETWEQEDIYIVKYIIKDLNEFALSAMCQQCESEIALSSQINELTGSDLWVWNALTDHNCNQGFSMSDMSNHNSAEENNCDHADLRDQKIKMYKLWHWHFAHLESAKLHNLHKVTILSKSISIVKNEDHVCEVCALTKFVNQQDHEISERKAVILALISINICRPLPLSYKDYQYFLKIIDNHSWKIWSILLKHWFNTPQTLQEWWLKTELQSGAKMQAVHSDNVTELKTTLDEWCMFFEITLQYTVSYMSIQNGVVK